MQIFQRSCKRWRCDFWTIAWRQSQTNYWITLKYWGRTLSHFDSVREVASFSHPVACVVEHEIFIWNERLRLGVFPPTLWQWSTVSVSSKWFRVAFLCQGENQCKLERIDWGKAPGLHFQKILSKNPFAFHLSPTGLAYIDGSCPPPSKAYPPVALTIGVLLPQENPLSTAKWPLLTTVHLYTLPPAGLSAHS